MSAPMTIDPQLAAALHTLSGLQAHMPVLAASAGDIVGALRGGHKLLVCGNGGSAAEAMHLVTELAGRYGSNRRSLPAIFLGGDASLVTCIANDFSFDDIFSRPLGALGQPGDFLVGFSTSGRSANVVRALEVARDMRIPSLALLGKGGGPCLGLATREVVIASPDTARIQEAHLFALHWLCERIEEAFA